MNRSNAIRRVIFAAVFAAVAVSALAQLANAGVQPPSVPDAIAVEDGHKVYLVVHAVGVQAYPCVASSTGYTWGASTPQANLYGNNGKLVGTHFGGPSWQANDGSKVMAQRKNGVTVDSAAIPWLLLTAKSPTAGLDGDRLVATTFIQRVATEGGLPPAAADCNADTVGTTATVPYEADYVFWKQTG